ncbi:MAG: AAC(3) family N-acetyltransferase, partial [Chloroflexota bacterium]|nr:AAC(3) family N-acetyltransferase [Chloroflexota bacterium]
MRRQPVGIANVTEQLRALGVQPGQTLQVHTAFSTVGPIEGGPIGLIEALRAAIGPGGTLVMPSMSDDDDHPFDPQMTPCLGMGVTADTFRRLPGVLRSDNPHAFAAVGPLASRIVAPHSLSLPHGLDSPVGRVYELGGHVLLLGIDHTSNTTIHLGEHLAGVRYRRPKHLTVLQDGVPTRFEYGEIDHCCERFALVDGWLDEAGQQRRGVVGRGEARL